MNKLLEVVEYDTITCNSDYINDRNYKYLDEKIFQNLINFIHEFTTDSDDSDVLNYMRISYKRNVGKIVVAKNYVGIIQMENGFQIQILPKISFSDNEDLQNRETKKIFLKMLRSMNDLPFKSFSNSNLKIDNMNLYEIFINMYLQETRKLIKKGLKSSYVQQEDNLHYYKGKLQVSKHIKSNVVHKEKFFVSYDEFYPNCAENKLIKSTLLKLKNITNSAENSKEIRQLLCAFEMVEPSINYKKDFSNVVINRNNKDYEILIVWSKVFLLNKSFTTFSGKNTSRALLFPMEKVFESYVAQQIKKILQQDEWKVSIQDRGYYLFDEPRKKFAIKHDIVCRKNNRTVIMDTKWKRLINDESKNYGISQSDMYQMYAYSKKYNSSEIWLLYPLNDKMIEKSKIKFSSDDGTIVNIYFVDVANIENSLFDLKNRLEENNQLQ